MTFCTAYAPLWCKSHFSFLQGASSPEELVEAAHRLGLTHLALTDRDGIYGVVEAHLKAQELGVHLIVGSEITLEDGAQVVLLAQDRQGYANLCQLISTGRLRCPKGESWVHWDELTQQPQGLWALLPPATATSISQAHLQKLCDAFSKRLSLMATRHLLPHEREEEQMLIRLAKQYALPIAACNEVLYHHVTRKPLHDVLTCIHHNKTIHTIGSLTRPNAEFDLKAPSGFCERFAKHTLWVQHTLDIARSCRFSLNELRYRYPAEHVPDGRNTQDWLRQLTFEGANTRYPKGIPPEVTKQLNKELALIEELEYGGYFLTIWEIVRFCKDQGILCQGRGSAANSAVCYCLGITAIDPVKAELLFERFLSKERSEPPDIDLDIAHARREEVIQHVYDKYGRHRAAMVANFVRYRARSAVRDVGKALGIPETSLDKLAKVVGYHGPLSQDAWIQAGIDPTAPIHNHLFKLGNEIIDMPRHLSIHPGGFLLGHEPVCSLVPQENATMAERTVIQWDKDSLEAVGLFKVDLLGLGALTQLDLAFSLLQKHHNITMSMASIPKDDPHTFEMICQADTVGVFQIESRAQMSMLPRLRPKHFYDLVIEVSIVRPGPITGGMVHPYLRRRHGEEPVVYPHPELEPVLKKTLGVPLFQEQVMKLAVVAANYSPGEADQLRRDMAAWRRSGRIEAHRQKLTERMLQKGIAPEFAERVFEQIRGFGSYGFPESHAASFALIAYATSYLRAHHLDVFVCSLLNAQPMGFYSPATIIDDAKRHGLTILPVDIEKSDWDCTLETLPDFAERPRPHIATDRCAHHHGPQKHLKSPVDDSAQSQHDIRNPQARFPSQEAASQIPVWAQSSNTSPMYAVRMGLRYVKGLREACGHSIITARDHKPFQDLGDVLHRTCCDKHSLECLATAGALRALGQGRRETLWTLQGELKRRGDTLPLQLNDAQHFTPLSYEELVQWDYAAASHSPRGHPLEPLRDALSQQRLPDAQTVQAMADGSRVRFAGLVICRQRPGTAGGVVFMTLEDETGFVNVVVWEHVFQKHQILAKTQSLLGVTGKLQHEKGVVHLIAQSLWAPSIPHQPAVGSRDFH